MSFLSVQTQVVGQTRVVPVQTITTTQQRNSSNGVGVMEVIFHGICTVSYIISRVSLATETNFVCGGREFRTWYTSQSMLSDLGLID